MIECKAIDCHSEALPGEPFCKEHYIKEKTKIFLNNTNPNDLGIVKWINFFFHYAKNKVPEFHKRMHLRWLHLYNPFYRNKMERLVNDICWRGGGKSTVRTFFEVLYAICNNGENILIKPEDEIISAPLIEKFIAITSETGDMAEEFVSRIRNELMTNERLKWFYPGKLKKAFDAYDKKWTQRAFKYNGCFVLGLGQGHQARGRIKGAYRITWLIGDDIYSEDSIKTKIGRTNVKKWWNKAVKNTVDDLMGKITLVGTIVHEDTVNMAASKNKRWKTDTIPLMPLHLFRTFIKDHLKVNYDYHTCKLPFDDVENEFERTTKQRQYFAELEIKKDWQLSWKDRADLYMIALKFQDAVLDKDVQSFYQEMFHRIVPDEDKKFQPKMFQPLGQWKIFREAGHTWLHAPEVFGDKPKNVNLQLGVDLSGAETEENDDVAISVACALPDEFYAVLKTTMGKFNMRDELFDRIEEEIETNRENIVRIGVIDECYRMSKELYPQTLRIGQGGGVESSVVREFRRVFNKMRSQVMVTKREQKRLGGRKTTRITDSLAPKYQAYRVFHASGLDQLETQLEFLGGTEFDDIADATEVAFYGLQTPSDIDYNDITGRAIVVTEEMNEHEKTRIFTAELKKRHNIGNNNKFDWRSQN